jgi:hypothetical protein
MAAQGAFSRVLAGIKPDGFGFVPPGFDFIDVASDVGVQQEIKEMRILVGAVRVVAVDARLVSGGYMAAVREPADVAEEQRLVVAFEAEVIQRRDVVDIRIVGVFLG